MIDSRQEIIELGESKSKRTEAVLDKIEKQYSAIVQMVNDGIVVVQDGLLKFANMKMSEITNFTIEEAIGKPFIKFISPKFKELVSYRYKKRICGEEVPSRYEIEIISKDGKTIPVEINASCIEYGGKPADLAIIRDISERKRSEETRRLIQFAINNTAEAAFWMGPDARFIYVNESACRSLGYTKEELLTMTVHDIDPLFPKKVWKDHWRDIKKRKSFTFESCHKTKAGRIFPVEITVNYLEFEGKEYNFAFVHDISKRKRAEEAIKKSEDQLRNLTAYLQRIGEIERTTIAREIHDELAQALTVLKMDLSWLRKRLPKEQKVLIERTNTMLNITNRTILTMKRISSDLRPGILDDLGLGAAIEWQAEEYQKRTGIKCKVKISPKDISFDRDRNTAIFRIFQETLTNVARHAKATEVTVNLKVIKGQIKLMVKDNGRGITEKKLMHPQSFGLIGIRERAKILGGNSIIKGVRGKGTTVNVDIPVNEKRKKSTIH